MAGLDRRQPGFLETCFVCKEVATASWFMHVCQKLSHGIGNSKTKQERHEVKQYPTMKAAYFTIELYVCIEVTYVTELRMSTPQKSYRK